MNRTVFIDLLSLLRVDRHVRLIPSSPDLFERAASLYRDRREKNWLLVDCASFAIMTELRVKRALTTDHHFAQAGFEVLLK